MQNVVERVVITPEGEIARVDLLPPFAYFQDICDRVSGEAGNWRMLKHKQVAHVLIAHPPPVRDKS